MSRLEDVGALDGWRCWICDDAVDPQMSVNDPRGPSIDSVTSKAKAKTKENTKDKTRETRGSVARTERLAHRGCNTRKGAVAAVVPWPAHLFIADAAPIIPAVDRLQRKGGREVMARCPSQADASDAATWLGGRLTRLVPDLPIQTEVEAGGGQFLLVIRSER